MDAETLGRAAAEIRNDFSGVNYTVQSDFMFAVADLLAAAAAIAGDFERMTLVAGKPYEIDPRIAAIAREYLNED